MSDTATTGAGYLKQLYAKKLTELTGDSAKVSPLWNLLSKKKGELKQMPTGGLGFIVPVEVDAGFSTGLDYSSANTLAVANSSTVVNFNVKVKPTYTVKLLDDQYAALSENDGAFVDAVDHRIEQAIKECTNVLAREGFGSGFGGICKITAVTATTFKVDAGNRNLITLNAEYQAAALETTGVLASATALKVTAIASDGTCTVTGGNPVTLTWAIGYTIFHKGFRENTASPVRKRLAGLEGWNPVVAPTAGDSFHSVDRSTTYKLYGLRLDASAEASTKDAMIKMISMLAGESQAPSDCIMNMDDWGKLNASLDNNARIQVPADDSAMRMGFATLILAGPSGPVRVVGDPNAKKGEARFFDTKHLYWLYASDDIIHLFNNAKVGEPYMSASASTSIETRVRSMAELVCDQTNSLGVVYAIA